MRAGLGKPGLVAACIAVILTAGIAACSSNAVPSEASSEASSLRIDPVMNKLVITANGEILWNGSRITLAELRKALEKARKLAKEPELDFEPDAYASYDRSAQVLEIIKDSGVTKFGFVGNERYPSPGEELPDSGGN